MPSQTRPSGHVSSRPAADSGWHDLPITAHKTRAVAFRHLHVPARAAPRDGRVENVDDGQVGALKDGDERLLPTRCGCSGCGRGTVTVV
eukprot:357074-Chlamydomonas_euryale.AAC.8